MRPFIVVFALIFAGSSVATAGDLAAGKKAFAKCRACHAVGPKAKNKVGPILNGILGRPWGAIDGYKYSGGKDGTLLAITATEPKSWDVETLSAYLRKPKDVIPKGRMAFAGMKKDKDIENIIFYLAQFDPDGNEIDPEAALSAIDETSN